MSVKLLVFGQHGQVARAILQANPRFELQFAGRDLIDLSAPQPEIASLIAHLRPAAVINAAAYTVVDRAEEDMLACARLNRDAPRLMAEACAAATTPFVHFSTDYVFDGEKGAPYVEADARGPINVYGRSKAEGEMALERLDGAGDWAIVRTSWVFSHGGANFLRTMLRLARERDEIGVVADQWGRPTPASDCAAAALTLIDRLLDGDGSARGIFHAAGSEAMSWADFAESIFAAAGPRGAKTAAVRRIGAAEFKTVAPRPKDTRLDCRRLMSVSDWRPQALESAIADCLDKVERA